MKRARTLVAALLCIQQGYRADAYENLGGIEFWANLKPENADHYRDIVCEGPLPQWRLPIIPNRWNPNEETSLLKICAAPQFGGTYDTSIDITKELPKSRPALSGYRGVGFFCYGPNIQMGTNYIPDLSVQETIINWPTGIHLGFREAHLNFPAILNYCRQRCYCKNSWGIPQTSKPKGAADSERYSLASSFASQLPVVKIHTTDYTRWWVATEEVIREENFPPDIKSIEIKHSLAHWNDGKNQAPPPPVAVPDLIDLGIESLTVAEQPDLDSARDREKPFSLADVKVGYQPLSRKEYTLWPGNKIVCDNRGPIPKGMHFPSPYRRRDFQSAADLCPITMSGGNSGANAGAYCDPGDEDLMGRLEPDIWFSDEWTPRLSWTWGGNWRFSAAVRRFCWERCWCANRARPRSRPAQQFFKLSDKAVLERLPYNTGVKIMKIKGADTDAMGGPGAAKGCDSKGCIVMSNDPFMGMETLPPEEAWPEEILGPVPGPRPPWANVKPPLPPLVVQDSPGTSDPAPLLPSDYSPLMCGQLCTGPAAKHCSGSADSASKCRCVVPEGTLARRLGVDPVASPTSGLCLDTAKLASFVIGLAAACTLLDPNACTRGLMTSKVGILGGRSLGEPEHWAYRCACNTTYASEGCCGSETGIVWEEDGGRSTLLL